MNRTLTLSLERAKEWYHSDTEELRKVAMEVYSIEELTSVNYKDICSFTDACEALNIPENIIAKGSCRVLSHFGASRCRPYIAQYRLYIIRRALNGINWEPKLAEGDMYYPQIEIYKAPHTIPEDSLIGKILCDNQEYLISGGITCRTYGGLSRFQDASGVVSNLGLIGCKSAEIAAHMARHFGHTIFDAFYGHYSYKWL